MHRLCRPGSPGGRWGLVRAVHDAVSMTRGARILVAEDDAEMRRLVAWKLRRAGFDVVEARTGADVLSCLEPVLLDSAACPFDVIVSDIRMPLVEGLEVLAGLRESGVTTPMILMTAFGDDSVHARARALGATAVFDKPFDCDALCRAVRDVVASSRRGSST